MPLLLLSLSRMQVVEGGKGNQLSSHLQALGAASSLNGLRKRDPWMQTTPPRPLSWAVSACGRQRQAILVGHRITRARALRAASGWTRHALGLRPLPGPVLTPPGDRRTLPGSHLPLPSRTELTPSGSRLSAPPPPPGPLSQRSLAIPGIWDRD